MVFLGNPEFGCDLQPIDFAAFARACGGTGITITEPGRCGAQIEEALHTSGPVLVEAIVEPDYFQPVAAFRSAGIFSGLDQRIRRCAFGSRCRVCAYFAHGSALSDASRRGRFATV
jgi:hypothetical protein